MLTAIALLGDQSLVPAQERIRCRPRGDLFQPLAPERGSECGKVAALCVRPAEPATTELGCQDAVFREEVRDDLLLVPLEPASEHSNQDVQEPSHFSGWRQDEIVRPSIHPTCATAMR